MFCPKCGTEIQNDVKFCHNCGYNVENLTNINSLTPAAEEKHEYTGEELYQLFLKHSDSETPQFNFEKAMDYLEKATKKGSIEATYELAEYYLNISQMETTPEDIAKNHLDKSLSLFEKISEINIENVDGDNVDRIVLSCRRLGVFSKNDTDRLKWCEKIMSVSKPVLHIDAIECLMYAMRTYILTVGIDKLPDSKRREFIKYGKKIVLYTSIAKDKEQHQDRIKVLTGDVEFIIGLLCLNTPNDLNTEIDDAIYHLKKAYTNGNQGAGPKLYSVLKHLGYSNYNNLETEDNHRYAYKCFKECLEYKNYSDNPQEVESIHNIVDKYENMESSLIVNEVFFNYDENKYVIPIGGYELMFNKNLNYLIKVNTALTQLLAKEIEEFKHFYSSQGDIDLVMEKAYKKGQECLLNIASKGVEFCAEKELYNVTSEKILDIGNWDDKPQKIWDKYYRYIENAYKNIVFSAQEERDYRQQRKDSRGRFIGGGFGIGGAINGMIQAEALNMVTGLAHDLINSIGNSSTNRAEKASKTALYEDNSVLNLLITGLIEATNAIKFNVYYLLDIPYSINEQKESKNVIENIEQGNLKNNEAIKKALSGRIYNDLYNLDIYKTWIKFLGDENKQLQDLAVFLGIANDLLYIKDEVIRTNLRNRTDIPGFFQQFCLGTMSPEKALAKYGSSDINVYNKIENILKEEMNRLGVRYNQYSWSSNTLKFIQALKSALNKKNIINKNEKIIPPFAYKNDKREIIEIPEGIEVISDFAFFGCEKLNTVILPTTLKIIDVGAFCECERLINFELPDGLEEIADYAFKDCPKFVMELPDKIKRVSVEFLSNKAKCEKDVWIPSSVQEITGNLKQSDKKLKFVFDEEDNPVANEYFLREMGRDKIDIFTRDEYIYDAINEYGVKDILKDRVGKPEYNIVTGENKYTYTINNKKIYTLAKGALLNSKTDVLALYSCYAIGTQALAASSLKELYLGTYDTDVRVIHDEAFVGCMNLEEVRIPLGVKKIGSRIFRMCKNLKVVSIPITVKEIGNDIFDDGADVTVYCAEDSYAYRYCIEHGIKTRDYGDDLAEEAYNLLNKFDETNDIINLNKAISLYRKAATYSDLDSLYFLGDIYQRGLNNDEHEPDISEAIKLYSIAAAAGEEYSAKALWDLYLDGIESPWKMVIAYKYGMLYGDNALIDTTEDKDESVSTADDLNKPILTTEDKNKTVPTAKDTNQPAPTTEDTNESIPTAEAANKPVPNTEDKNESAATSDVVDKSIPNTEDTNESATTADVVDKSILTTEDKNTETERFQSNADEKNDNKFNFFNAVRKIWAIFMILGGLLTISDTPLKAIGIILFAIIIVWPKK